MKRGQTLYCKNEGCRAKFSTAPGYIAHQKICGVKEEEREKFPCEICDKVYMSFPGLQYHMKVNHTEVNIALAGLNIMAGQRTMSGQMFCMPVILVKS